GGTQARYNYARALLKAGGRDNHAKAVATLEKLAAEDAAAPKAPGAPATAAAAPEKKDSSSEVEAASSRNASRDKFWRKLASETLANEKTENGAKEGMKP